MEGLGEVKSSFLKFGTGNEEPIYPGGLERWGHFKETGKGNPSRGIKKGVFKDDNSAGAPKRKNPYRSAQFAGTKTPLTKKGRRALPIRV